jgi:glutaredoxin 3
MGLLERSKTYKPFQYANFVNRAETHEKLHWIEQEIDLSEDVRQWNDGTITPVEKNLIVEIMKTFTQSDTEVATGYIENFMPTFKNNEVRSMLLAFAAREGIHQRAYALFTDTIGLPDESFSAFLEYESLTAKIEAMTDMNMKSHAGIAKALARTVVSEGISLFGAFAMLLNFQRQGKMMGLSKINEWSLRDESEHTAGMVELFHQFLTEHPKVVTDELKADIYQMFRDAVKLEDKFVDLAFEMGDVEGLTKEEVKKYIRYIADRRLIQLGLKGNYGVKENPLPWLDWIISADNVTNFFEQRVADYSAAGLTGSWGW